MCIFFLLIRWFSVPAAAFLTCWDATLAQHSVYMRFQGTRFCGPVPCYCLLFIIILLHAFVYMTHVVFKVHGQPYMGRRTASAALRAAVQPPGMLSCPSRHHEPVLYKCVDVLIHKVLYDVCRYFSDSTEML